MTLYAVAITQPITERPTNALRFYNEVLQQKYEIVTFKNGVAYSIDYEWRDIEKVTSDSTSES